MLGSSAIPQDDHIGQFLTMSNSRAQNGLEGPRFNNISQAPKYNGLSATAEDPDYL
jgi:hypothetical protein